MLTSFYLIKEEVICCFESFRRVKYVAPKLTILVLLGFELKFKLQITCNYLIKIGTSLIMVLKFQSRDGGLCSK